MLEDVIKEWGGHEVSAMDVYREMFRLGYGEIQSDGEAPGQFKANPIGYWKNTNALKGHYRIMFDDTFEEVLQEMQAADFSILNGISYFGRKNVQAHASKMYAMIFDIDGITDETLGNFFSGCFRSEAYPIPNYVILSGHGIHLYYLLEYGVPLYPNIKLQLKELKYALTRKMWNRYTSTEKKVQYQGINQGFRVIGGKSKIDGQKTRAFELNTHPFNLEELSQFVPEESRVDETKLWRESRMTLEQAKEKFPDWYERRVVQQLPKGTWTCKRDLYDWWLRRIKQEAAVGHRYFCVMCLAIYATKSGIEFEELQEDAHALIPYLDGLSDNDPFTEFDCDSALECYDERYITFPRKDMEKVSGIEIPKNKRNGRTQAAHVRMMNLIREDINGNTNWRDGNGRKSKKTLVREWNRKNPNGTRLDCEKELGIARSTIDLWWDGVAPEDRVARWQKKNPEGRKADCVRETGLTKPTVYKYWKK